MSWEAAASCICNQVMLQLQEGGIEHAQYVAKHGLVDVEHTAACLSVGCIKHKLM